MARASKDKKPSEADEASLSETNEALKAQIQSARAPQALVAAYETTNLEEAASYNRIGGHVVSVAFRNPSRPYLGKRIGFSETKDQLDALKMAYEKEVSA